MKKIFLLPVTFLFFCSCDSQEVTMVKQQHLPYCETYTLEKLMGYIFDSPQWFETERADEPDSLFVSVCGVVKSQNVEEVCFTFDIVEDDQAVLVGYDYNGVAKVPGLAFRYFIPHCAESYKQHFNSEVDDISVILKEVLKEGKEETVEMLEQMKKLMDGVPMGEKTAEFIRRDAIIQTVTAGERSEVNIDSMRRALLDSVDQEQIRKNSEHTKNLHAWVWGLKENFYGAFANQYDLMYRDLRDENGNSGIFPLSVKVQNFCPDNDCHWASVLVQAWISGFTDTSSVTIDVNPNETEIFAPKLIFDNECLQNLNAPKQTQIQIRAYAMVGDNPTLFFTKSEPITIHPMQVNGSELAGVSNRGWWDGVWVTPNMDSISIILDDVAKKLPDNTVKVYQKYYEDKNLKESSMRVLKAVFETLQERKIRYIQNGSAGCLGQKNYFPIEVLRKKQAVCNEFSYLLASVLEAMDFEVALISVPEHMFVGELVPFLVEIRFPTCINLSN